MNNLYSVFDSCSGNFGNPFVAANDACAKRLFDNSLAQPSVPKYIRDDSVLYGIGYFDSKSGYFSSDVPPYVVSRGCTIVPSVEMEVSHIEE